MIFRVIVAGSRGFLNARAAFQALDFVLGEKLKKDDVVIVSGGAQGPDTLGKRWAEQTPIAVKCVEYPAEWAKYGRSAGMRRNEVMADNADALVAFWDGVSVGTKHMIERMVRMGKPVRIVHVNIAEQAVTGYSIPTPAGA